MCLVKQLPDTFADPNKYSDQVTYNSFKCSSNVLEEQYQDASHACSVVGLLVPKIRILVYEKEHILIMVKTRQ